MEELAPRLEGQVLELDKMEKVREAFARLPEPQAEIRRVQLWSHPLIAATLIGLLGVFGWPKGDWFDLGVIRYELGSIA